jgi:hypothetical protein
MKNDTRPSYDPTANVVALVEAAMKRQDDLRFAESRRVDEQLKLRTDHASELAEIRATSGRELRLAESSRIDANRATDLLNVSIANDKAGAQAAVLASQVVQTADTLRALVATNNQATEQRLITLERASIEGKAKGEIIDPQIAVLIKKVDAIAGTKSEGVKLSWSVLMAVITILIAVGTLLAVLWSHVPPQQVIYTQAPEIVKSK